FAKKHEKVVLKPSYFGAGSGVVLSAADDPDFGGHIQTILDIEPKGPVIAQGFLPEVADGDTRVMMLNGEVMGAVGRRPPEGEFRANIAQGGTEFAPTLSNAQRAIAKEVGAFLVEHGIVYAGLDFIGNHLIEMNVTSPTLVQELRRVGGPDMSKLIWDHLEAKAK
ncbi:MAG: glutathione synthase, partial [Pseudomonadota bacterium]